MTAWSSACRAREPPDRCEAAAGHQSEVVSRAPALPYGQRRMRTRPARDDGGIDRRKHQRHRLAFPMAQRRHPLVARGAARMAGHMWPSDNYPRSCLGPNLLPTMPSQESRCLPILNWPNIKAVLLETLLP
jgi:hypothetical protein